MQHELEFNMNKGMFSREDEFWPKAVALDQQYAALRSRAPNNHSRRPQECGVISEHLSVKTKGLRVKTAIHAKGHPIFAEQNSLSQFELPSRAYSTHKEETRGNRCCVWNRYQEHQHFLPIVLNTGVETASFCHEI
jgi:hypothetical protein